MLRWWGSRGSTHPTVDEATPVKTTDSQLDGFEVIELANDAVRIAVMPALGAKVISLRYLPTGGERMWSRPRQPQFCACRRARRSTRGRWSERTSVCRRLRPARGAVKLARSRRGLERKLGVGSHRAGRRSHPNAIAAAHFAALDRA